MKTIVNRSPYFQEPTTAESPTGRVIVRPHQIIVWVSLVLRDQVSRSFPAILDTGHSHNFSIRQGQVDDWAGVDLRRIGTARINRRTVELKEAQLALHRNIRGKRDDLKDDHEVLEMPEGIAVHEEGDPIAPRLPLLGLRALTINDLRLVIDGRRKELSISRP